MQIQNNNFNFPESTRKPLFYYFLFAVTIISLFFSVCIFFSPCFEHKMEFNPGNEQIWECGEDGASCWNLWAPLGRARL